MTEEATSQGPGSTPEEQVQWQLTKIHIVKSKFRVVQNYPIQKFYEKHEEESSTWIEIPTEQLTLNSNVGVQVCVYTHMLVCSRLLINE